MVLGQPGGETECEKGKHLIGYTGQGPQMTLL
nr:MAG TPA: hypothetical protein [Caudoviricetes sp.]